MSDVEVRILGCGDAFGSGGRLQTCFYGRHRNRGFLIDCGTTALSSLKRYEVDPARIETILITHLHGDHFGGLPFFLLDAQFNAQRQTPLTIAGPPGLEERLRSAQEVLFPGSSKIELRFTIAFSVLSERCPVQIGDLEVTAYPVIHPSGAPSYALRVACGDKVLAYSGDSDWTESLVEVAQNADLFLCEAYYFEKKVPFHLDYETLVAHHKRLGCKKLVLTHMHADLLDRHGLQFPRAEEGLKFRL